MKQEVAVNLVKDIIQNAYRHKSYNRTVELAKEYKACITGDGIDDYLQRVKIREDEETFALRKDITVNITETLTSLVIDPQYKLPRSNSIERRLFYKDDDVEKLKAFTEIKNKFYEGNRSVEDYMSSSWIELNNLDPNTFIVLDWLTNTNKQRIQPYPVEYPSDQVYHFNKKNGVLEWICLHREEEGADPEMYLLYGKEFTVVFTKKRELDYKWKNNKADIIYYQEFPVEDFHSPVAVMKNSDDYYDIYILKPHNLGYVPGLFAGYVTDLRTRRTYVSPIHKGQPILKKIIKLNSEFDITLSKHAFQQKIQYGSPCPNCHGNGKTLAGLVCKECQGTGNNPKEKHESGMDTLVIPRPRDANDLFDLSKLIHYVPADVRIPKFQYDTLQNEMRRHKEAVYNSNVFSTKEFTETAYSKNVDLQNVYDALWPMAQAYARAFNFIIGAIAKITDLDKNLIHNLSFRKDFKMKSLSDLYQDLSTVGTSNADEFVKKDIENDIAQIMYEDDERALKKYYTMRHFFPFNGKTKDEIKQIITSPRLCTERVKVLYANYSYIFDELELEFGKKGVDFYYMSIDKQKKALDKKVETMIDEIEAESPQTIDIYGTEGNLQPPETRDRQAERTTSQAT